jgi:endonuclease YncB( thermonuclease family)
MLNRLLIQFGYATVKSPFSFKFRSQFMDLERKARNKEYGMWQDLKY